MNTRMLGVVFGVFMLRHMCAHIVTFLPFTQGYRVHLDLEVSDQQRQKGLGVKLADTISRWKCQDLMNTSDFQDALHRKHRHFHVDAEGYLNSISIAEKAKARQIMGQWGKLGQRFTVESVT
jgi:hypothetical protein